MCLVALALVLALALSCGFGVGIGSPLWRGLCLALVVKLRFDAFAAALEKADADQPAHGRIAKLVSIGVAGSWTTH